jgi:hypothetical protein
VSIEAADASEGPFIRSGRALESVLPSALSKLSKMNGNSREADHENIWLASDVMSHQSAR